MNQYIDLLSDVLENGEPQLDRTGVGTHSVFGRQCRYRLSDGFPLLTARKLHFKSIVHELLWFIKGSTNTKYLTDNGVTIWDEWADANGELGPIYGKQWRSWPLESDLAIDQLWNVINSIKTNPSSRRHIVSAWNVSCIDDMALPPCHLLFQFRVSSGTLDCLMYQRSADLFLGVPFNIASYSLLLMMVAQVTGLKAGEFIHTIGDAHLYLNHFDQTRKLIGRIAPKLPRVTLNPSVCDIDDFTYDDITLCDYNPLPAIKAEIAV